MPETVFLSFGANIGDREANIVSAITALSMNDNITDIKVASLYETEPLVNKDQPPFLNTVVQLNTTLRPFDLLDETQKVEQLLGRPKNHKKNAPRIIDIDIICFGSAYIDTDQLHIPHPMLAIRKFVLVPFNELVPDFIVPLVKKTVKDLLKHCPDTTIVRKHIPEKRA